MADMALPSVLTKATTGFSQQDREMIERAYEVAERAHDGQTRASGEPFIVHSLAVGVMLAELRLDPRTIAAGLLHDVPEDTSVDLTQVRDLFGEEIAQLVDGVTKLAQMDRISMGPSLTIEEARAESLRKMFLAMVDDVRVVLIKLADRLHKHAHARLTPRG